MSTVLHDPVAREIYDEIARWPIFDPHSHIDPHRPAARNFEEILGYHYYTELAHSAGMPAELVIPGEEPRRRAHHLAAYLDKLDNTIQHSWLIEIARTFHDFGGNEIGPRAIETLLERAEHEHDGTDWDEQVWNRSRLEAVFLTNDFDDTLEGWDTARYVPCLRTDDLVLKLHEARTLERLRRATNVEVEDAASLRLALSTLFGYFVARGARACAISLPPDFVPARPSPLRAVTPIRRALHQMDLRPDEHIEIRSFVFWTLAELCAEFRLPFDLMIGPIRNVYLAGVADGRDLFDRRVSLYDFRDLFNHFSQVIFPISTLAPDAAAELVAYSWIFPNVVPMGHWWYSNVPAYIAADLRARLQAVPKTKQVGYYSDAYKLEFILPKFNMYRRILAEVLASEAIRGQGWPLEQALEVARLVLIDNPRRLFSPRAST
jgi:glucuronate isomerase